MCFSLGWFEQLCVWLICVCALVAIIRLLVPWLLSLVGAGSIVAQIVNIILWAVIAIMVVYIIFALLGCLLAGGGLPLLPHGR